MSSFILFLSVFEASQTNYIRDSGTFILFEIKEIYPGGTTNQPQYILAIGNRLEIVIKITRKNLLNTRFNLSSILSSY